MFSKRELLIVVFFLFFNFVSASEESLWSDRELIKKMLGRDDFFKNAEEEFKWSETPTERILVVKVKSIKDGPLDIKIENGLISISRTIEREEEQSTPSSGTVQKSYSTKSFSKSLSVPNDTDGERAIIENNKANEIVIRLPKLKKQADDIDRVPVTPNAGINI